MTLELLILLTAYILDDDLDLTGKTALYLDEELHLPELALDTLKSFLKTGAFMDNKKPFLPKDFKGTMLDHGGWQSSQAENFVKMHLFEVVALSKEPRIWS